jgi:hypothetical protein
LRYLFGSNASKGYSLCHGVSFLKTNGCTCRQACTTICHELLYFLPSFDGVQPKPLTVAGSPQLERNGSERRLTVSFARSHLAAWWNECERRRHTAAVFFPSETRSLGRQDPFRTCVRSAQTHRRRLSPGHTSRTCTRSIYICSGVRPDIIGSRHRTPAVVDGWCRGAGHRWRRASEV